MEFTLVKEEIKRIGFKETDADSDNLFEGTVLKDQVDTVMRTLNGFFGEPAWPSKNRLSLRMEKLLKQYGGIMAGQTLYLDSSKDEVLFAMLWPWKDGQHTTVKIIQNSLEPLSNTGLNDIEV
jgi:hypothetical protein